MAHILISLIRQYFSSLTESIHICVIMSVWKFYNNTTNKLRAKTTFRIWIFCLAQILTGLIERQHVLTHFNFFFKFSHCLHCSQLFSHFHRCFLVNIAKFFRTAFFIEHLHLLVTEINRRDFEKKLLQNSKDNMLHNSISLDMKVYALQLKQKFTEGVSNGILQNFRTATFENNFCGLLLKRKHSMKKVVQWPLWFQVFTFSSAIAAVHLGISEGRSKL